MFRPIGVHFEISDKKISPPIANATLENEYEKSNKKLTSQRLNELSKKVDIEPRDIERWWRRRRAQDRPTSMNKFCDSCWKFAFYSFSFTFGLIVAWDKSYYWNILECFLDYPHHVSKTADINWSQFLHLLGLPFPTSFLSLQALTSGVWYYNMIELSFYCSSTLMHLFEIRRKDFWQMLSHHIVTVSIVSLSWVCNVHRIGLLLLTTHDCADIFMEAGKALNYAKFKKTNLSMFSAFTLTWIVTRLVIYPRILYVCVFHTFLPFYPAYFLFNSMLFFLLFLHLYWTYLIFTSLFNYFKTSNINDSRSSSEDDQESLDRGNECGPRNGSEKVKKIEWMLQLFK